MCKWILNRLLILAVLSSLTACLGAQNNASIQPVVNKPIKPIVEQPLPLLNIHSTMEVAYFCGQDKEPMRVLYGVSANQVKTAQISFRKKLTPVLVNKPTQSSQFLKFENSGITWLIAYATDKTLSQVKGHVLMQQESKSYAKQLTSVKSIIVRQCIVDEKMTQRLNTKNKEH